MNFFSRWKILILFGVWSLGSLLINQAMTGLNLVPWLYLLRFVTYLLFGLAIFKFIKTNGCSGKWLKLLFSILVGMVLGIGFFQYLFIPDLRFLASSGWDVHYFRLAGNMLDPNFTGIIVINLLITAIFICKTKCKKMLYFGIVAILALALTYSRSSYLSMAVIVMVGYWLSTLKLFTRSRVLGFLFLGLLVFLPFLPRPGGLGVELTRTETISSRVGVNENILEQLDFHQLLIGRGLFTPSINTQVTDRVIHANFPDNLIVFVLSSTGVVGLWLISIFLYQEMKIALFNKRVLTLLLIAGTVTHSMLNLTVLEPINLLVLMVCLNMQTAKEHKPNSAKQPLLKK